MGLDILAVHHPVFAKPPHNATDEDWEAFVSIEAPMREWIDRLDGMPEGFYRAEKVTRHGGWSYGGYNRLRELICVVAFDVMPEAVWADPEHFANDGVFGGLVALIWFSDCEGAFGPVTSRRLAGALQGLDLLKIEDRDERDYAEAGVTKLLACFSDAARHNGFAVWS